MPALTYSYSDFTAYTKIKSTEVNAKFNDIKTLLNTTKLDTDNVQLNGLNRNRLATGTANHVVINGSDGNLSSEAQLAKSRGGTGYDLTTQPLELPEIATPSTPASGFGRVYFKSDGKLYQLNDGGTETQVGAGGGGSLNLITLDTSWGATKSDNSNAENSVGDWAAYADAAATSPVDMTGGSPNTAITRITSSMLNGIGSFKMAVSSGATRQGEGVSCLVYVPLGYRGRNLSFTCPFNISGTVTEDDFRPFAYDVTNSTLITPYVSGKLLGSTGKMLCTFPVSTTTAQIRVGIHVARASNTGAVDITFDDVSVSPDLPVVGMAGSDWLSYTPTFEGFGTPTSVIGWYRRVGDSLQVTGSCTLGTTTGVAATVSIPSGLAIDVAKLSSTANAGTLGIGHRNNNEMWSPFCDNSTTSKVFFNRDGAAGAVGYFAKTLGNVANSGDGFTFSFTVPISGWSSNVNMAQSSVFNISSYLANGTRVTTTPAKLGEYRTRTRTISASTMNDNAPGTAPSAANGMLIYNRAYGATETTTNTEEWQIFIGKNKKFVLEAYASAAKTGRLEVNTHNYSTTEFSGLLTSYDPSTGVLTVASNVSTNATGAGYVGRTGVNVYATSGYFDVVVSENAQAVGVEMPRSELVLNTNLGHGSGGTTTVTFTNSESSTGTAFTYTADTTNGDKVTINEPGLYGIYAAVNYSGGGRDFGITKNSSSTSTSITSIAQAQRLGMKRSNSAANSTDDISVQTILSAGDVIRVQDDGGSIGTGAAQGKFRIVKLSN